MWSDRFERDSEGLRADVPGPTSVNSVVRGDDGGS
jgi:hypothetical protein